MDEKDFGINWIKEMIKGASQLVAKYKIIFLTSNKAETNNSSDYNGYSIKSEFFSESEQSVICSSFNNIGFQVMQIYNEEDFVHFISTSSEDLSSYIVVNSAQKGTKIGRKSLIPALCDLYNIKYIGSNPYIVSLCRDKYRGSSILKQNEIQTPQSWLYDRRYGWLNGSPEGFSDRLIIKPNYESSSIGIDENCIGYYNQDFQNRIREISDCYCQEILVEEFIEGYETEIPVICYKEPFSFFPVGINLGHDPLMGERILNYRIRSIDDYEFYDFSEEHALLSEQLIQTAIKVTKLLNLNGFGRVDFRIKPDGRYYVTDISTNPHYTEKSSYYYTFNHLGFHYQDMISCLIISGSEGDYS